MTQGKSLKNKSGRPAVFLDRDGVLNRDTGYVYRISDFFWMPGSIQAVEYLNRIGYLVFVVTNQSGVARGYYTIDDVISLHNWMNLQLERFGAHIDKFYFCPHHPTEGSGVLTRHCSCRKPEPGMILTAIAEWDIDKKTSFLVGDRETDLEASHRAGVRGHLIREKDLYSLVRDIVESCNQI